MLFSGNGGVGVKSVSFENSELSVMVGQNETVVAVFESDKDQNIELSRKRLPSWMWNGPAPTQAS